MQIANRLKAVEQNVEKEVLAFFRLMGASEAPEEWESSERIHVSSGKQDTGAPPDTTGH